MRKENCLEKDIIQSLVTGKRQTGNHKLHGLTMSIRGLVYLVVIWLLFHMKRLCWTTLIHKWPTLSFTRMVKDKAIIGLSGNNKQHLLKNAIFSYWSVFGATVWGCYHL